MSRIHRFLGPTTAAFAFVSLAYDPLLMLGVLGPTCPVCSHDLDIHQPDEGSPERLLGTCPECGSWFLIDPDLGQILLLPDARARFGP